MPCASSCPLCSCSLWGQALTPICPLLSILTHAARVGASQVALGPLTGLPASSSINITSSQGHSFLLSFQLITLLKSLPEPDLAFTACPTSTIHKPHPRSHCIVCSEDSRAALPTSELCTCCSRHQGAFLTPVSKATTLPPAPPHTNPLHPLPMFLPPCTHPLTSPVGGGARCGGARAEG